jgi:hypothetical protein
MQTALLFGREHSGCNLRIADPSVTPKRPHGQAKTNINRVLVLFMSGAAIKAVAS